MIITCNRAELQNAVLNISRAVAPKSPIPDDANTWKPYNDNVTGIIEKWYLALKFPQELNREFYKALETVRISDAITIDRYDFNCTDGKRNLPKDVKAALLDALKGESVIEFYLKNSLIEYMILQL